MHPRDEVVPVLGLLQAGEGHLGARDVFLGVLKILDEMSVVDGEKGGSDRRDRRRSSNGYR